MDRAPGDQAPEHDTPSGQHLAIAAELGRRVAQARNASGLTLAALGQRAGLSVAFISQIEAGSANPTLATLSKVAAALDLGVAHLLGAEDPAPTAGFAAGFMSVPGAALAPGISGIWDGGAVGAQRLGIRLVHGSAGDHAEPIAHVGEEFVAVLAGRCRITVGSLVRDLHRFDLCHFDAAETHRIDDLSEDLLLLVIFTQA